MSAREAVADSSAPRRRVLRTCGTLAGAELTRPFGDGTAVFKVAGKIFAIVDLREDSPRVTLKCDPDYALWLVQQFAEIVPGYHMNKRHWITVALSPRTSVDLVDDLIVVSYDLVVTALPVSVRSSLHASGAGPDRRSHDPGRVHPR